MGKMKTLVLILFLAVTLNIAGCSSVNNGAIEAASIVVEEKTVSADDKGLSLNNGTVLYNGEPFSGTVIGLYEGGDTASVSSYYLGKENGWSYKWYPDGTKMEERYYENGKKEGTHRAWYEDGSPRFVYNFVNGEYNGSVQEWYPNGQMYKNFYYEKGYETGMQTAWETNGKLLANYEVKNGRKYGLTGTHNCKSLWDNENSM